MEIIEEMKSTEFFIVPIHFSPIAQIFTGE
jgi:hypothetical protein